MIEDLREESRTILLTTHYMEEAERLANQVAIIMWLWWLRNQDQ